MLGEGDAEMFARTRARTRWRGKLTATHPPRNTHLLSDQPRSTFLFFVASRLRISTNHRLFHHTTIKKTTHLVSLSRQSSSTLLFSRLLACIISSRIQEIIPIPFYISYNSNSLHLDCFGLKHSAEALHLELHATISRGTGWPEIAIYSIKTIKTAT